MSWSFLTRLLDEISNHSTFVGKIWLTLLIVFRIVLTAVGGESIYYDEQSGFVCNTQQHVCENTCYDAFAPLSHIRFWVLQVIMVTTPTILYLGFAMHTTGHMDDSEDPMILEDIELEKGGGDEALEKPCRKRDGLMKVYVFQLIWRATFEAAFLIAQYVLYGLEVPPSYVCTCARCTYTCTTRCTCTSCTHTVDCFVSRPKEKTVFLMIMYAVSAFCLLSTVLEILHLGISGMRECLCGARSPPPTPRHPALAAERAVSLCRQPSAPPPGYHSMLKKDPVGKIVFRDNLADSGRESFGDEASSRELERLRRHLKLAQQHLDLAYQHEECSPPRSSSPESNGTAVEQNRLNFAQEKEGSACEKGERRLLLGYFSTLFILYLYDASVSYLLVSLVVS